MRLASNLVVLSDLTVPWASVAAIHSSTVLTHTLLDADGSQSRIGGPACACDHSAPLGRPLNVSEDQVHLADACHWALARLQGDLGDS